jgi:hypothetical protein
MKKLLVLVCLLSLVMGVSIASARCVGPVVNGECLGTEVYGAEDKDNSYQGSSGTKYQYNLEKPKDRNDYSIDLDAQRRDQMSTDPGKDLDEKSGQRGGGILDD